MAPAATTTLRPSMLGQLVDPAETAFGRRVDDLAGSVDPGAAARLLRGLFESDPLADDLVVELSSLPGGQGWCVLDDALATGLHVVPEGRPALRAMLEEILEPPDWVDWELFDAGCIAYRRAGLLNAFGGALSLSYGYPIARIAKVLLATGRIEELAGKRLVETGQWALAATAPGNMRPGVPGTGIASCVRVRIVHAYVRRHMLVQDDWDVHRDGIPLNATDTAATLNVAFFTMHLQGLEKLGLRYSPAEKEAMAHMWRWIGHVMGVPHDLQPLSYRTAVRMHDTSAAFNLRTDSTSAKTLTAALVRHGLPSVLGVPTSRANDLGLLTVPFTSALLAYMLGPDDARTAGLRRNPLRLPMRAAPLAGRAYNLLRASGVLGDDATMALHAQALVTRLLTGTGLADTPVHPEAAVRESRRSRRDAA